jgi:hypothetical protein
MPANKGRVKVHGVKEMEAALKKVADGAADLKAAHTTVARVIVPGSAQRSPRRTGARAASWAPSATKGRARISSRLAYAPVIEYGWGARGIEPARMVRDTIEAEQGEIIKTYEAELERLGKRAGFDTKNT